MTSAGRGPFSHAAPGSDAVYFPVPSDAKPDLQKKLREVPHKPGVYLHRDRFGTVIYVGKARDLR